jgi:transcriptional regulator with XRE-family HTH domain
LELPNNFACFFDIFFGKIYSKPQISNNQRLMKGQKIKEILKAEGLTLSEVARLLGFEGDQRLHSALKSDDVKTGLVEDIARVTNKSICLFYDLPAGSAVAHDNGTAVAGCGNNVNSEVGRVTDKFISLLEKKDEQIDRLLALLEVGK